jgi:geranylgeranyl reductase family protein
MVMKRPDFDVIVAGAGAGGAAAAYFLTQAGLSVLVVEKARLPRYKACGGAIPRRFLAQFPIEFEPVVQAAPISTSFCFPGLPEIDVDLPDQPIVMVMRSEFDAFLLSQSGAEVLEGVVVSGVAETDDQVQVTAGDDSFTARYVVGADGPLSQVARSLGLRQSRQLGGTLEAEVPLDGNGALQAQYGSHAVFVMGVVPWGYSWIFPKGDCLSVGIARFRPGRVALRSALVREMEGRGISLQGTPIHGHPMPCYQAPTWPFWPEATLGPLVRKPLERLSTRRCLLVGDAAGLVDPLIGEGIRYAISSARLAAGAIAKGDLSGYETTVWRQIGRDLGTAGLAARIYYSLPWLGYQLGLRNRETMQYLVDVMAGRASYQGIGRKLIAATIRQPFKGNESPQTLWREK